MRRFAGESQQLEFNFFNDYTASNLTPAKNMSFNRWNNAVRHYQRNLQVVLLKKEKISVFAKNLTDCHNTAAAIVIRCETCDNEEGYSIIRRGLMFSGKPVLDGEITSEEFAAFNSFMQVYHKGAQIIQEGQINDRRLFLLRQGVVGIYKNTGDQSERISTVQAVNFFGEMTVITGGPRSATVRAETDDVVVYAFRSPELKSLIANPIWGSLLVTRMAKDLDSTNALLVQLLKENRALRQENEHLRGSITDIMSLVLHLQQTLAGSAVLTTREWQFLKAIIDFTRKTLSAMLPGISENLHAPDKNIWKALHQQKLLPDILFDFINKIETKSPPS